LGFPVSKWDNIKLSISTQCSPHCTTLQLLKRMLDMWELLKSPLVDQNPQGKLKQVASGPAPGTRPSKRLNLLSLTENKNSENTESILKGTFQPKSPPLIDASSCMMLQSAMKLAEVRTPYSQTLIASPGFTQLLSCQMESNLNIVLSSQANNHLEIPAPKLKSAIVSTPLMVVGTPSTTVISNMPEKGASAWAMGKNHVMSKKVLTHEFHPKYLRYNIWDSSEHFSCSSADWTETASPLPTIPDSELANPVVTRTINKNPHLFDIITPIFVECFKELLQSHPNQPFIESVCRGLCEGFWPWADTHIGDYPDTIYFSLPEPEDPDEAAFLQKQRDHEVFMGCFSESFGDKLLPGMYCMPIFAIPKPHSMDLWMVTDQSTRKYCLNSMIPREDTL